jgi:hypothetical protein
MDPSLSTIHRPSSARIVTRPNTPSVPLGTDLSCNSPCPGWRRHGLHGALHVARDALPLVQGEGLALREEKEHVEVLDQLALLQCTSALERVPPEADEELQLRRHLVLEALPRSPYLGVFNRYTYYLISERRNCNSDK